MMNYFLVVSCHCTVGWVDFFILDVLTGVLYQDIMSFFVGSKPLSQETSPALSHGDGGRSKLGQACSTQLEHVPSCAFGACDAIYMSR